MNNRITITLDENIESELRNLQAEKISSSNGSVSFSDIINQILRKGLENSKN